MSKNKSNPDMAQDEFTVSFIKKDNRYEVATYAGTNKQDSRYLLIWATVAAEITNTTISGNLPKNSGDLLLLINRVFTEGSDSVVKF